MSSFIPEYSSQPFTVNGDYIPVPGDFNGSGITDILWYKPGTGADYIWSFNSDGTYSSEPFTVNGDYIPVTGDFDGSGTTDILWYRPGTGADYIWSFNSNGTYSSEPFTVNGDYDPVTGDFDGSGTTDILWYKPGTAADYIWYFNSNGTYNSEPFTVNGDYDAITGDFDRSGTTDIFWYKPGTGADYIWYFNANGTYSSVPNTVNGEYVAIEGDFNGDAVDDILWYAPGTGADYLMVSDYANGTYESVPFTVNGVYEPVSGDFDGNGYTDILWYKPGTESDYLWSFREAPPAGDPLPPSNSTLATATDFGVLTESGWSRRDFVGENDPNDYYRFTLETNGRLGVTLGAVTQDAQVQLIKDFNNNGEINIGDGDSLESDTAYSNSNAGIYRAIEAGTYYVRVSPRYSSYNTNYDLDLSFVSQPSSLAEDPGNNLRNALDVGTLRQTETRRFTEFVGETDWNDIYQFTVNSNSDIEITVGAVTQDAQVQLIKDFNNNGEINIGDGDSLESDTAYSNSNAGIYRAIEAGTYYVRVSPRYSSYNTNYDLTISV